MTQEKEQVQNEQSNQEGYSIPPDLEQQLAEIGEGSQLLIEWATSADGTLNLAQLREYADHWKPLLRMAPSSLPAAEEIKDIGVTEFIRKYGGNFFSGLTDDQIINYLQSDFYTQLTDLAKGKDPDSFGEWVVSGVKNAFSQYHAVADAQQLTVDLIQAIDFNDLKWAAEETGAALREALNDDGKITFGELILAGTAGISKAVLSQIDTVAPVLLNFAREQIEQFVGEKLDDLDAMLTALINKLVSWFGETLFDVEVRQIPSNIEVALSILALALPRESWDAILLGMSSAASAIGGLMESGLNLFGVINQLAGLSGFLTSSEQTPWTSFNTVNGVDYFVVYLGPAVIYLAVDPMKSKGQPILVNYAKFAQKGWKGYLRRVSKQWTGIINTFITKGARAVAEEELVRSLLAETRGIAPQISIGSRLASDAVNRLVFKARDFAQSILNYFGNDDNYAQLSPSSQQSTLGPTTDSRMEQLPESDLESTPPGSAVLGRKQMEVGSSIEEAALASRFPRSSKGKENSIQVSDQFLGGYND